MKHFAENDTPFFPGALTKPCDLNVSAMSMIKYKSHFYILQLQISCTVLLVCHVAEDTAPKSCYGDGTNEKGVGPGDETGECPSTGTRKVTGWEDDANDFSLRAPCCCCCC